MIASHPCIAPQTGVKPALSSRPAIGRGSLRGTVVRSSAGEDKLDRRSALLLSLGVLLGSAHSAADAATSDAYYAELKANTKGLDSADLLSRYSSLEAGGKKKGAKGAKSAPSKNVAKNAEVLGLKGSKPVVKASKSSKPAAKASKPVSQPAKASTRAASASAASFNPVEVGLGLVALAGVGVIGSRGSSKSSSKPASSQKAPAKKPPAPAPKRAPPAAPKKVAPPPPPKKKSLPVGTQKLRPGTKPVQAAKTKRVGTVAKGAPAEKGGGGAGGAGAAVGVVALAGAAVVLSGGSQKDAKQAAPPKEPAPVEKKAEVKPAPAPAAAPEVKAEKTQALIVKVDDKKTEAPKDAEEPKSKLPPTTGNSPAVLVGGSLVALIAAAAVGGSGEDSGASSSSSSPASTPAAPSGGSTGDDAAARAKEARQWIETWRAKQK